MKKRFTIAIIITTGAFLLSFINFFHAPEISLNSPIPLSSEKLKTVSGKEVSLSDVKTKKGLLVIFSCNTCPYVKLSEVRIKTLTDYCLKQEIGCIILNSNEAERSEDDSYDAMIKYAQSQKFSCDYAIDNNSKLADAFGATRTPQCFLFTDKGLVYKGAIDDNVKDASLVKTTYLKDAIDALVKSETPKIQETKSIGCTIKRME
ncbi:MAG: redoxin family protein [Bacteroidota bacterium]